MAAKKRTAVKVETKPQVVAAPVAPAVVPVVVVSPSPTPPKAEPVAVAPTPQPAKKAVAAKPSYTLDDRVPMEKKNKQMYWAGLVLTVVVLVMVGGVGWARIRLVTESEVVPTPTSGPVPATEVVQEELVDLSRENINLEILNGSGVAGAAGAVADKFELLGYANITTGNTPRSPKTELLVDPAVRDRMGQLLTDAKEILGINEIAGELTDSSASARIIVGE